jgi:hypothetical protein
MVATKPNGIQSILVKVNKTEDMKNDLGRNFGETSTVGYVVNGDRDYPDSGSVLRLDSGEKEQKETRSKVDDRTACHILWCSRFGDVCLSANFPAGVDGLGFRRAINYCSGFFCL